MAVKNIGPESTYQGPTARTGDTEDGLYPDAQGDLGHEKGGDTASLPGSNEPLAPASGKTKSKQDSEDRVATLESPIDKQ